MAQFDLFCACSVAPSSGHICQVHQIDPGVRERSWVGAGFAREFTAPELRSKQQSQKNVFNRTNETYITWSFALSSVQHPQETRIVETDLESCQPYMTTQGVSGVWRQILSISPLGKATGFLNKLLDTWHLDIDDFHTQDHLMLNPGPIQVLSSNFATP